MRNRLLYPALLLLVLPALAPSAQDEEKKPPKERPRYGFEASPILYPQATPKETIASVVKAIDAQRVDYMLAQLADPKFVDTQVAEYRRLFPNSKGDAQEFFAFDKLVNETVAYYLSDPILLRELRLFARDGVWEMADDAATGAH